MSLGKRMASIAANGGLLSLVEQVEAQKPNILRILAYHRLGTPESETGQLDPVLINSSPEMFAQQMEYLKEHYHVISIDECLDAIAGKSTLPPRSVMITFDDNYRGFLESAWPVLNQLQLPSVFFVTSQHFAPESPLFWWDQLHQAIYQTELEKLHLSSVGEWPLGNREERAAAIKGVKDVVKQSPHHDAMRVMQSVMDASGIEPDRDGVLLTRDEVRFLSENGVAICAHTQTHPMLSRLSLDEATDEIFGSYQELQEIVPKTWPVFAYTFGTKAALNPDLIVKLREAGFQAAVTMLEGHNNLKSAEPLWLKRLGMAPHLSLTEFRMALTGIYSLYGALSGIVRIS